MGVVTLGTGREPDFSLVDAFGRDDAATAWENRDIGGVFVFMSSEVTLQFVASNFVALRLAGMYEEALAQAWIGTRTNWCLWSPSNLRFLFRQANREVLQRAFGGTMPPAPYTLYRGVAGVGPLRRVRNVSWTGNREIAEWFATRYGGDALECPAIYSVTLADARYLWAYTDERDEDEHIVLLPSSIRPTLVWGEEPQP